MKFGHFIPHVNRLDLTEIALKSLKGTVAEKNTIVIDNSPEQEFRTSNKEWDIPLTVYCPDVPLTTAQTMNLMRKQAIRRGWDCFGFQHNDGEPYEGTVDKLYEMAAVRAEPWGALFSTYDVCCVFNTTAVKEVGEWDWLRFPFYHLDNDYYHRLRLAGYPTIETGLGCMHHSGASSTIKSDSERYKVNAFYFPVSERLLLDKWGKKV